MSRTVALLGNPNTGKTTLFNALTGLSHRVGNYPGVTVESKIGTMGLGVCSVSGRSRVPLPPARRMAFMATPDDTRGVFRSAPWGEPLLASALQRLVVRASDGLPGPTARTYYFNAGRVLEAGTDAIGAADFYAQAVLQSDLRAPDTLATLALQRSVAMLERAGFKDDAAQFYRRAIAQKEPPKKPPKAKAGKPKK